MGLQRGEGGMENIIWEAGCSGVRRKTLFLFCIGPSERTLGSWMNDFA